MDVCVEKSNTEKDGSEALQQESLFRNHSFAILSLFMRHVAGPGPDSSASPNEAYVNPNHLRC